MPNTHSTLTSLFSDIADAIRDKKGTSAEIVADDFPDEIASITGGGAGGDYNIDAVDDGEGGQILNITDAEGGSIDRVSWHQCPQLVRDYLDEVTYNPNDYSTSQIATYAPNPAVSSNTKPIGTIVDGVTYHNEVPNKATPFASANKAGTLKPLDRLRWINSVTNNMRDIGGWTCDGGTVKYGLVYRSAEINSADKELFIKLGITKELDLTADGTPAFAEFEYIAADSYAMYALTPTSAWQTNLRAIFNAAKYRQPLLFHCSMGADRTGTLACVVLGLLGVAQSDIDKEYELTSFYYAYRARNGNYQGGVADWAHLIAAITALNGDTFRDKCVTFAISLGFTYDDINAFRNAMIDGTPEPILPSDVNLFVSTPNEQSSSTPSADDAVSLGARLNSSGKAVSYNSALLVTRYIEAEVGDVIEFTSDVAIDDVLYGGYVSYYDSSKTHIGQNGQEYVYSDDHKTYTFTVPPSRVGTAYIRIGMCYADMNNITIYKR